jgi:hypothetical protein
MSDEEIQEVTHWLEEQPVHIVVAYLVIFASIANDYGCLDAFDAQYVAYLFDLIFFPHLIDKAA